MPPPISSSTRRPFPFEGLNVDRIFRRRPEFPANNFQAHRILVVYNPNAAQGAYAREAGSLRSELETMGFDVHFLETVRDPQERLQRIRDTSAPLLENNEGRPLHVLPLGGDTTVDEVVREVVQNITGPLHEISPESGEANNRIRNRLASVIVLNTGTAADVANQLRSPPHFLWLRRQLSRLRNRPAPLVFGEVPEFLRTSQVIPQGITALRSPDLPDASAFHSVDYGVGGRVFELGDRNRTEDPTNWRNRGIFNYVRVLPQAIREYPKGFIVEIEHHGRVDRFRVGDVLGSTSRTIAGLGGIPGRWGEFKIMAIPPGPAGIAVLLESVARGIPTIYMGRNMVDADSSLWTLPAERDITLRPGERAKLRFFDVVTGEAIRVPWQSNGGGMSQHVHEAEVYVPPITVPLRTAPVSLGKRLYQLDELRRGLAMGGENLPADFPMTRLISPPQYHETFWGGSAAATGFFPASDLRSLALSLGLESARVPLLVAKAHGVHQPSDLSRFESHPLSMEAIERWTQSEEGIASIAQNKTLWRDSFRNRFEIHVPGLALGAATMYLSNRFAKGVGIDPERDPFLHFTFTALTSHAMNQVGNASAGVLINRWRGIPYDLAMMETRSEAGLMASRMLYEYNPNPLHAMRVASLRSLGFQGGARSILWRGAKSVFTVPGSMAMGMGMGLASSRISEKLLERIAPGMDPVTRYHLSSAAFFAPNIYHLAAGNRGLAVLESSTFRRVGRAFSWGFVADLAFMGVHSLYYGNQASEMRWRNHLISQTRERHEHRGLFSMHGVFSLLSPELAAWWDARA